MIEGRYKIAHSLLALGENIKGFHLPHKYTQTLMTVEGRTCVQLTFVTNRGKIVEDGKIHHYSMVRAKDDMRCPEESSSRGFTFSMTVRVRTLSMRHSMQNVPHPEI